MIQRAYRTKLRPTCKQRRYFGGCCGAARFVFNWALADRKEVYESGGKPSHYEQKKRFNQWKKIEAAWLYDYPYTLLEEEFRNVDKAFANFFRRVKQGVEKPGYPKFKRRGGKSSFTLRGSINVEKDRIKLPRIGWVSFAEKDYIPIDTKINTATISESVSEWFISVQVEEEIDVSEPVNDKVLGVDVGVKSLAVLSDGRVFDNPQILKKHEKKMARLQKELARRNRGSQNWKKTKVKIKKLHLKITRIRRHMQHDTSRAIVDSAGLIVLEDLNIKGMMAKPKPKLSIDGTCYEKNNRSQKRGLSRSLSDVGLHELHRQINYKAEWVSGMVLYVDRWYPSSKTCSRCGSINVDLSLADRTFNCLGCGYIVDRDLNAAVNLAAYGEGVKRAGLSVELEALASTGKQEGGKLNKTTSVA